MEEKMDRLVRNCNHDIYRSILLFRNFPRFNQEYFDKIKSLVNLEKEQRRQAATQIFDQIKSEIESKIGGYETEKLANDLYLAYELLLKVISSPKGFFDKIAEVGIRDYLVEYKSYNLLNWTKCLHAGRILLLAAYYEQYTKQNLSNEIGAMRKYYDLALSLEKEFEPKTDFDKFKVDKDGFYLEIRDSKVYLND